MNVSMLFSSRVSSRSIRSVSVGVKGISGEDFGQRVAFAAANLGFGDSLFSFLAVGADLHFGRQNKKWTHNSGIKNHVLTSIGEVDSRNRASVAQFGLPIFKQAAFFAVAAAVVIAIEVGAFFSGRCSHGANYSMEKKITNTSS